LRNRLLARRVRGSRGSRGQASSTTHTLQPWNGPCERKAWGTCGGIQIAWVAGTTHDPLAAVTDRRPARLPINCPGAWACDAVSRVSAPRCSTAKIRPMRAASIKSGGTSGWDMMNTQPNRRVTPLRPEDALPDQIDHAEIGGVTVRKGTVAAFL